ncbi:DNA polymerase [Shewanella sp. WPAGA9]|uniref:DNA polymerase n=1 Tax=Shewanella sp. ENK2 TaxID=2775245 RepID=UPI0017876440|nr:DNA polymerase [Shewanella sp. WPAGA9]
MQTFLSKLDNKSFSVTRSSEFRLCKNGNGYNFTSRGDKGLSRFFRVYYHCPNQAALRAGSYIICYRKSVRALDRLDACAIIAEKTFVDGLSQEIADQRWRESFVKLAKESSWAKEQLVRNLYTKLIEGYEQERATPALKGSLTELASGLHLEGFSDVVVLLEGKLNSIVNIPESFDFKAFESQLSDKLKLQLIKGVQNSFKTHLSSAESYIERKFLKPETLSVLIEYVSDNPARLAELSDATLKLVVSSNDFCPDIDTFKVVWDEQALNKRSGLTSRLNNSLLPQFLDELPVSRLVDFLLLGASHQSEEQRNRAIYHLISKLGAGSYNQSFLSVKIQQTLEQADVARVFIAAIRNYSSDAVELIKLAYSSRLHLGEISRVVVDALTSYKASEALLFLKGLPDELVLSNISDDVVSQSGNDYVNFLEQFAYLQTENVIAKFDPELLPLFANYASESQFIEYLCHKKRALTSENQAVLKQIASSKNFCEAKLLITLYEMKSTQRSVTSYQVVNVLGGFQTELFNYHAIEKTKIELKTFPPCAQAIKLHRISQTKMSVCEGKLINVREPKEGEYDYYVLCKRSKCANSEICSHGNVPHAQVAPHTEYAFFTLVQRLFGISPRALHSNDQFVRILSALNRWNEILERLFCECCKSPLSISEHSRDSMGKMAVGTTYWHCSNDSCREYAKSVKISYCIGCQKVIDNRVDKRSCTPYNIRSYEKFYICNSCASCCSKHSGNAGICPNCGIEDAYRGVAKDRRTKATCRNCQHEVSISPFGFNAIEKHKKDGGVFNSIRSITTGKCHLIVAIKDGGAEPKFFAHSMPWDVPILYAYDLFECLKSGYIKPEMLSKYEQVYDLKVLEKMAWLGLNHSKYGLESESTLVQLLKRYLEGESFQSMQSQVIEEINRSFNRCEEQSLWSHYNTVEHRFVLALHNLVGNGIAIDKSYIETEIQSLEVERNKQVRNLLDSDVYHPDHLSVQEYLAKNFGPEDANALLNMFQFKGASALRSVDPIFENLHRIDKIERSARIATGLVGRQGRFIPGYDTMGTVTGRCTSKSPNLMGLPRESRHIIRPESGMQIIECDYKQMEIGVLAGLSRDELLIEDFNTGDVYSRFAESVSISRDAAKTLVLGILYGMTTNTLATLLKTDESQAKLLIEKFFTRYEKARQYQKELVQKGEQQGYLESVSGLRRFVNNRVTKTSAIRNWENNWFKNFPIQSAAATIFKLSIIDLADQLYGRSFKLIVPHYDAIVFQVPIGEKDKYTKQVEAAMFRAMKKQFPDLNPQIDVKINQAMGWGAMKSPQITEPTKQ